MVRRAIFVLESNSGYLELLQLLEAAGDRSKARPTDTHSPLPVERGTQTNSSCLLCCLS